jgi:hypothetical protein
MIASRAFKQATLFNPDNSYIEEMDAFEVNEFLVEWPQTGGGFLSRLAMNVREGSCGEFGVCDFETLVASVAFRLPEDSITRVHLEFAAGGDEVRVNYQFGPTLTNAMAPIEADNPGFFAYAMRWFARSHSRIDLCISRDYFWVEATK